MTDTAPSDLLERLAGIGEYARLMIPGINGGGCASYAAAVATGTQRLGLPTWALVHGFSKDSTKVDPYRAHIIVQFRWRDEVWSHDAFATLRSPFDLMRRCTPGESDDPYRFRQLTIDGLLNLARASADWGSEFPHQEGTATLAALVRFCLDPDVDPYSDEFELPEHAGAAELVPTACTDSD